MNLRPLVAAAAVLALAAGATSAAAAAASRNPRPAFASASAATVKPGVQTVTGGKQCTANFVFTDRSGAVYLGQSAHCAGTGAATQTNGCQAPTLPLGTPVTVRGAKHPGRLAYSSWVAMQRVRETDDSTCRFNDFALVRLDRRDVVRTNPSVPAFGGPVGVDTDGTRFGERVVTYGNSNLRFGLGASSPKRGVATGTSGGGWTHSVYTVTPGIPGDSGSAVLDADGRALGTLSTLTSLGSNGITDLARATAYARSHGVPGLTLVHGTEKFTGAL